MPRFVEAVHPVHRWAAMPLRTSLIALSLTVGALVACGGRVTPDRDSPSVAPSPSIAPSPSPSPAPTPSSAPPAEPAEPAEPAGYCSMGTLVITGRVVWADTGAPATDATVAIETSDGLDWVVGTQADPSGYFILSVDDASTKSQKTLWLTVHAGYDPPDGPYTADGSRSVLVTSCNVPAGEFRVSRT